MSEEQDSNQNNENKSVDDSNSPDNKTSTDALPATPKVLSLAIKDLTVLYSAYMPFVEQGGLFIPTKKVFNMGDKLPLLISLMDDTTKYSVDGNVVWITPISSTGRTPGIGVQFTGENAKELYKKIEKILIDNPNNSETTNTM